MSAPNSEFFWFYQNEHNVLVLAVAFGLGPRIAAENLLLEMGMIEEEEIRWRCKEAGGDLDAFSDLIEVRLLLNFGVLAPFPDFHPEHSVWIDCVDWLRKTLPPHIQKYQLLLREEFFTSPDSSEKGDNAKWSGVKPLIRSLKRATTPDPNLILLSFGGVATPYSTNEHKVQMPLTFLHAVKACLEQVSDKSVMVFLPEDLLAECEGHSTVMHKRMSFHLAERNSFMEAMQRCGLLICQPGLYTPFEAMEMGVPLLLTYPMSFTQSRQGKKYHDMGIASCTGAWANVGDAQSSTEDIEVIEKKWFVDSAALWQAQSPDATRETIKSWLVQYLTSPLATFEIPMLPKKLAKDKIAALRCIK